MASTTPSVSFPVRWSSFITIETREPRLILARSVPAILGNLPFLLLRCGPERRIMLDYPSGWCRNSSKVFLNPSPYDSFYVWGRVGVPNIVCSMAVPGPSQATSNTAAMERRSSRMALRFI
jgi:hypothetical protein